MKRYVAVVLCATMVSGWQGRGIAQDPVLARDEFVKRYTILPGPADTIGPPGGSDTPPRVEAAASFDDEAAAGYRYAPSISAIRDVFLDRVRTMPPPPRDGRAVQRAIDDTFGVSRFGRGFRLTATQPVSSSADATIELIEFRFGSSSFGQALVGRPAKPNGTLLVALHGCVSSPDDVMIDTSSYAHAFGLRAVQRGYTVVAPYLLSGCMWIHNLDWLGSLSGVSVFGYELAKIGELTRWAAREYDAKTTVVWGISLGGQYSMLASALHSELFDVTVISGASSDYEASYRAQFEEAGVDASAGKRLGTNTQVALSARVARRDVIASILPRPLIFEISTTELKFAPGAVALVDYVDRAAVKRRAPRPRVVLFEGDHETHPEATLKVIAQVVGPRRKAP